MVADGANQALVVLGANSRAFDSNTVDRATYFAVMGLLQDTC